MEQDFWHQRWQANEIGFHQDLINPWLAYFYGELGPPAEKRSSLRVFVPLCGKSRDMLWLAQNGYEVVGLELSEIAVKDFFAESQIQPDLEQHGNHTHYTGNGIKIIRGDYFSTDAGEIGRITDVFDRASLVAMPEDMRWAYAQKMTELLEPGGRILLVTLTYPQDEMDGPPFSVTEDEVYELFGAAFSIDKLAAKNTLEDEPRFRERGLTSLAETAYKLTKT